jgi:hypothetical protein
MDLKRHLRLRTAAGFARVLHTYVGIMKLIFLSDDKELLGWCIVAARK